MSALRITILSITVITSIFLMLLILMHKGRGGGLSDMFGGGMSSGAGSSGVAERNLNIITTVVALVWFGSIVAWNLVERFDPTLGIE